MLQKMWKEKKLQGQVLLLTLLSVFVILVLQPEAPHTMGDKKPAPAKKAQPKPKPAPYSWVTKETIAQMEDGGVADPLAQKNMLWVIQAETGGVPKRENMNYTSAARIAQVFANNKLFKGLTPDQAARKAEAMGLVKNPQALANAVYGGRMGNTDPDDGWKYRAGAGIGITGRANYEAVFEKLGMPKDTDPEVLTQDPNLAMRANLAFLQINGKGKDLSDINQVNKIIRSAVPFEERLRNNPMPSDEVIQKAKDSKKTSSDEAFSEIPPIAMDADGNPTLDTRPSNA